MDLKPCPFCGSKDLMTFRLGSIHFAQCTECDVEREGRSEAEAITAWNTRRPDELTQARADIARLREALEGIDEFGKRHTGHGFSCATLARSALEDTTQ